MEYCHFRTVFNKNAYFQIKYVGLVAVSIVQTELDRVNEMSQIVMRPGPDLHFWKHPVTKVTAKVSVYDMIPIFRYFAHHSFKVYSP